MKRSYLLLLLTILMNFALSSPCQAQEKLLRKVDNFIFFLDHSGSMGRSHTELGKNKLEVAKSILAEINQRIPDLGFQGAMYTFAPFDQKLEVQDHVIPTFDTAIENIDSTIPYFGRQTPLGDGIHALGPVLAGMEGRTAVILVSDGASNRGMDPVVQAKQIYTLYPASVCFHVVSLAENNKNEEILTAIAALNECSVMATAPALIPGAGAQEFVEEVFYDEMIPMVRKETVMVEVAKDSDGDGVFDRDDKCPGTSPQNRVDERGCPILTVLTLKIFFESGKAEVKDQYLEEIRKIATYLEDHPDASVTIEGHTDSQGSDQLNKQLSQRRANSVRDILIENFNIATDRVTAVGYGESKPIAGNDTAAGRQQNRRVTAVITGGYVKK